MPFQLVSNLNPTVVMNVSQSGAGAAIAAGTTNQTSGTVTFGSSAGNVTFGMSNGYVTASAPSGGGGTNYVFSNSNGVSFGTNGSTVTATVATNYQSQGAYLTTAMASNAGSNFAGLGFSGTNASGTMNSNGLQLSVAAPGGGAAVNFSAGTTSNNLQSVVFATSPTVTFGLDGATITASVNGGVGGGAALQGSGTYTQNSGTIQFANSNNMTFGLTNNVMTASYATSDFFAVANSSLLFPTANTTKFAGVGETVGTVAGTDLAMTVDTAGVSIGYPKWITTYSNDLTSGRAGVGETVGTIVGSDLAMTVNTDGVSIGYPKWLTTAPAQTVQPMYFSLSNSNTSVGTMTFGNLNGVSWSYSNGSIVGSVATNYVPGGDTTKFAGVGETVGTTAGSDMKMTVDTAGISLAYPKYLTTADATAGLFVAANSSNLALVSHSHGAASLSLAGGLSGTYASNSAGFTLSMTQAAAAPSPINFSAGTTTSAVSGLTFSNSNNITFGLGTGASAGVVTASFNPINIGVTDSSASGTTGILDGGNAQYLFFGGNNITISQSINGSSGSLSIIGGAAGAGTVQGGYTNLPWWTGTVTLGYVQSTSHVIPFFVPANLSFDYVRMLQVGAIIAASTTAATTGNATFSCGYTKTHNLHIFSRGAGANSDSLQMVASTGFTEQFSNNIACAANSTQFSYSNRWTVPCSSGALGFTYDYSSSQASLNVNSVGAATSITGTKWIDLPFGTSLAPGQYWLMYGVSTTTAVQSAGTTIGLRNYVTFNPVYASQAALSFGTLGAATSNIYAPQQGLGSFTTVGGATTNSLHWSKVTASAANPQLFFALLRSA